MNRPPAFVAAFTLIEMMIAVALGSLIIYTAVSGFRTASQTITSANRLSMENNLLRAGYFEAQVQLDFWTNLDDPTKPNAERPLRQTDTGKGLPFTPLKAAFSLTSTLTQTANRSRWGDPLDAIRPRDLSTLPTSAQSADPWEDDFGWDCTYYWSPHDPRTWNRANMAEKERHHDNESGTWKMRQPDNTLPPFYFGRYAIFANAYSSPGALYSYKINPQRLQRMSTVDAVSTGSAAEEIQLTYSNYPTTNLHHWNYRLMRSMFKVLGYAGACEYLPPNAIYTWYTQNAGFTTYGGIDKLCVAPWHAGEDGGRFPLCNGDGDQRTSRGIYRQTYSEAFGYFNPRSFDDYGQAEGSTTNTPSIARLREWHYQHYSADYGAYSDDNDPANFNGKDRLQWFMRHVNHPETIFTPRTDLTGNRPINWPDTFVSVGRYIKNARHVALAKVRQINSLTGEVIELSWTGLGTSLRGARQQRHLTTGWARWDNGSGATIDPHLDSQ